MQNKIVDIIFIGYQGDREFKALKENLESQGKSVMIFLLGCHHEEYSLSWSQADFPTLSWKGNSLNHKLFQRCSLIFSKWWRLDNFSIVDSNIDDLDEKRFIVQEWNATISSILKTYYDEFSDKWVGNLLTDDLNSNLKLYLLNRAAKSGFNIPITKVSEFHELIFDTKRNLITKAIGKNQQIHDNLWLRTTDVDTSFLEKHVKGKVLNTPMLLQEKIVKDSEIRVFYFENEILAIELIEVGEEIDSRLNLLKGTRVVSFEDEFKTKVLAFFHEINVSYCSLDFIVKDGINYLVDLTPEGSWYYYENDNTITSFISKRILNLCQK